MWCRSKLTCFQQRCVTYPQMQRLKERELRRQSGLSPLTGSGSASATAATGPRFAEHQPRRGAIIVRSAKARYSAWASCAADERLVSGGCSADKLHTSRPDGYQKGDTIGARWRCTAMSSRVTAYALCAKLPPAKLPRATPSPARPPAAGKSGADGAREPGDKAR